MQATSDEVLISRIAAGDRLAMQVLYARHHVKVYRFVLRLVGNAATAEDLNQRRVPRRMAPGGAVRGAVRGLDLAAGNRPVQGAVRTAPSAGGGIGRGDRG